MIPSHPIAVWRRGSGAGNFRRANLKPDDFAFAADSVQRLLQEVHGVGQVHCLCRGEIQGAERQLSVRMRGDTYFLARYPLSRAEHDPECRWALGDEGSGSGNGGDADELRVSLPVGRSLRERPEKKEESPDAGKRKGTRSGTRPRSTTLLGLFLWLFDEAELTWWHPGFHNRRSESVSMSRIRRAAERIKWAGRSIAEGLVIAPAGSWSREAWGFQRARNREALQGALERKERVLVIAELLGGPEPLRSSPKVRRLPVLSSPYPIGADPMGEPELMEELRRRFPTAWAELNRPVRTRRVWLIGAAEPRSRDGRPSATLWLKTASLAMTTAQYIPVDSEYEAVLAERLVREGRAFRKPVRFDGSEDTLPDFELRDLDPPMPLEVFGMSTGPYLEARARKTAHYDETLGPRGWWFWDATRDANPPNLPQSIGSPSSGSP